MSLRVTHVRHLTRCAAFAALVAGCEQQPAPIPAGDPGNGDSSAVQASPVTVDSMQAAGQDTVLSAGGWLNLRIGMTRAEVVAAAGEDAYPEAAGGPDPETYDEFHPVDTPDGLIVMIRSGRLSRISISEDAGTVTDRGIAVGDSVSAVHAAYGPAAEASAHAFHAAPAQYLTVWEVRPPSPAARGIVYEITGTGHVRKILAGDESITYPEGCV